MSRLEGADDYLRGQRRIALLFDVLGRFGAAAKRGDSSEDLSARVMRVVARHTTASPDFERHRKRLAKEGKPLDLAEVFDLMTRELPGWCPWLESPDRAGIAAPSWSAPAALGRLVTNSQGSEEKGKRLAELVRAATRLLARGSLGRAATAIAEAERIVAETALPSGVSDAVRAGGFEGNEIELFRPFMGAAGGRACLHQFVRFFRRLQPVPLLQALAVEEHQERRHLILVLLEAHGEPARREAVDLLRSEIGPVMSEAEALVRRNLIYLLRRVPRDKDENLAEEVEILARHAQPHLPSLVVKEAILALGQLPGRKVEQALLTLQQSLRAEASGYEDSGVYLERVTSALARRESVSKPARRTRTPLAASETYRMSGDGLPSLLHELAETHASGSLLVEDGQRGMTALLTLREGMLAAARLGALVGADALFTLIETFDSGTAVWSPQPEARRVTEKSVQAFELRELVVEGLRRRDEWELARAIVPDDSAFAARTDAPRPHPEEKDGLLTRDVWEAAVVGHSPKTCEKLVPADAYRVRRLLLYWAEEGALEEVLLGTKTS